MSRRPGRPDRHIVEVAFAVVPIEHVRVVREVRLDDVEIAVEIEVADAEAHAGLLHAVFVEGDAPLEAFLRERAIVIVAEQKLGVESQAT